MMMQDDFSSGFTTDITRELQGQHMNNDFECIESLYASNSGHARLFSAVRYGKRYVLKCLKEEYAMVPLYRQALRKEFEIGMRLEHDSICRTLGFENVVSLGACIVMDYVDGDTMQQRMEAGRVDTDSAWRWARQLMAAMDYLHSKQIVHRDLKPQNIMITHAGNNVRLIDFSLSDADNFSILKWPAGTKGYIAPEQQSPDAVAHPSADVYSLGVVMSDLARMTKDSRMLRVAKACMHPRPELRPMNTAQMMQASQSQGRDYWLLAVAVLAFVLSVAILVFSVQHYLSATNGVYME